MRLPGDTGPREQPHTPAPDFPLVGQPRRGGQRRLPVGVPARCQRRLRPRQARRVKFPHRHRHLLQNGLLRRRGHLELQEHQGAHQLHGRQLKIQLRGRLRERHQGRYAPRGQPPFLAGKETMDLGKRRLRTCLGPKPHRPLPAGSQRPASLQAIHRVDGGRLYREPARLRMAHALRGKAIRAIFHALPRDRHRQAGHQGLHFQHRKDARRPLRQAPGNIKADGAGGAPLKD